MLPVATLHASALRQQSIAEAFNGEEVYRGGGGLLRAAAAVSNTYQRIIQQVWR
jgi:hypothetical protein